VSIFCDFSSILCAKRPYFDPKPHRLRGCEPAPTLEGLSSLVGLASPTGFEPVLSP
jgi:hypothetical protein